MDEEELNYFANKVTLTLFHKGLSIKKEIEKDSNVHFNSARKSRIELVFDHILQTLDKQQSKNTKPHLNIIYSVVIDKAKMLL